MSTNNVLTSTNGINWSSAGNTNFSIAISVAYGGGKWVVVGTGIQSIMSSNNGTTWSSTTGFINGEGTCVSYGGGLWLAGGYGDNGNILQSENGIDWTTSYNIGTNSNIFDLLYNPTTNLWVACGYNEYSPTTQFYGVFQ